MLKVFVAFAFLLIGHKAEAQHLWWNLEGQKEATCLYGEITVLATHPAIYYCGANWHPGEAAGGYCGIQHNSATEKRTIFSIWDTTPALHPNVSEADPRTVAERRADALGVLAGGADRLRCRCGQPGCGAGEAVAAPVVIHVVAEQAAVEGRSDAPGFLHGTGALVSAELLRELATGARLRPLIAGGGPEAGYRPSERLAGFVKARDLTCRAPGCRRPAVKCDLDHTIPHAQGGSTCASNIKCLCRLHHLLKTFAGWRDRQLEDGTVIWELPDGQTYVTTPGSALLFPGLMTPTGPVPVRPESRDPAGDAERAARMPRRKRTRKQNRARRIAAERNENRRLREAAEAELPSPPPPRWHPDDPPPF